MDIGEAKRLYRDFGSVFYQDELIQLDKIKAAARPYKTTNDTYTHALFLTDWVFRSTKSSLQILSGPTIDGFLETLNESFIGALHRIKAKGNVARLIIAGPDMPETVVSIQKENPGCLEAITAEPANPESVSHFIVGDIRMVREEKAHPLLNDSMNIDVIKATVHINNNDRAKVLTRKFDEIWKFLSHRP